jgi:hypothetical protein
MPEVLGKLDDPRYHFMNNRQGDLMFQGGSLSPNIVFLVMIYMSF